MSSDVSISGWICGVQEGDSAALKALWEVYYPKLVRLARQRLRDGNRRIADEEDVAISVMESFFRAAQEGRFANLADRDDLWRLLLAMTVRKAIDQERREGRIRRGGGKVRGESVFGSGDFDAIAGIVGAEPTPEMAAMMTEEMTRLLGLLDDEKRQIAVAKLEGYTNLQISKQLDCSERTIDRRMEIIKRTWERDAEN